MKTLVWEFVIFATHRQIWGAIAVGYNYVDCEWREKVSAFSLFYCRLSEVVKTMGLLCRKVTLKFVCYVTLGLAACSMDL